MDFVTTFFNDKIEINLLKLQAVSFTYVDAELVNKVWLICNDMNRCNFKEIIDCYPESMREKVTGINVLNKIKNFNTCSNDQQIHKFQAANLVKTDYYIVLETKNHFLKPIFRSDYFDEKGKPRLFVCNPGNLIKNYYSCLEYYNIKCPFNYDEGSGGKLITTTPYLLCKSDVLEMIAYITKKEGEPFYNYFLRANSDLTDFYLYSTYLILANKLQKYKLTPRNFRSVVSGPITSWNSCEYNCSILTQYPQIKIFGLDRSVIQKITKEDAYNDKERLAEFYSKFYSANVCDFIKNILLV